MAWTYECSTWHYRAVLEATYSWARESSYSQEGSKQNSKQDKESDVSN